MPDQAFEKLLNYKFNDVQRGIATEARLSGRAQRS